MSFRESLRKFKSDAKSRIFQSNKDKGDIHAGPRPSSTPSTSTSRTPHRWIHLNAFLRTLEEATRPLSPLKSVVADLAECVDSYKSVLAERKEYENLHHELEEIFLALQRQCTQNTPPAITLSVEAICNSIQAEITHIRKIQHKSRIREYLEVEQDMDEIIASYRRIQGYLQRIALNADISIWKIVDEIATDNRLSRLSASLSACYNSAQAVELKRGPCTEGTRVEILGQILGWVDGSSPGSVYWMSGMAGTGKTTIAYSLCKELDAGYKLAASFFCSRLLPECRDVSLIIPLVAYQFAQSSHPFRFKLAEILEKDPDVHTRLPHLQFDALISKPLLEVKDTLPDNFLVVIDALDECENKESTSRILDVLLTKSSNLPVKFIISSRPEPEIRDEMIKQNNPAKSRVILHELDKQEVQADIETYLRSTLAEIQPTEGQIATLVERAGILFIYAATVVRYIGYDRFRRNPRLRLANILEPSNRSENKHKEIDELYTTILRAVLEDPSLDHGEREDIRQVLYTVICAQEPLTVVALSRLLKMNDIDRVHAALRPLWSVLHVSGSNQLVTTLHASFSDYMFEPLRSKQYHCNPKVHNQTIARLCFGLFKDVRPQFNICSLESSYIPDNQVEGLGERIKNTISPELFYASRYWAVHLNSAIRSPDLIPELEEFLSMRLLLWMEVMNLTGLTGIMPQAIRLVEAWKMERSAELSALISDARRFTSTFALNAVCESTSHIYVSMLPFWPKSNPVSKCYSGRMQRVIAEGTATERQQHSLLATWSLGGDYILSLAFSPNGTRIAAALDNMVLLLNSLTGRIVLLFEGHNDHVSSVQFSPDGIHIVSGSYDKTIRIWNTYNGNLTLGPLHGHTNPISCVAFSPDGDHVVSGSTDGQIYIWNAHKGERVLDLSTECRHGIGSIKYSPDGSCIVSCYGRERIVIWDAREGRMLRTLGLDSTHYSFAFADISPDGTRIAFTTRNEGIYICDYGTGEIVLGPLTVPSVGLPPRLVLFSPNGLYLVSDLGIGRICIWDALNGNLVLGPLEEHTSSITSACFSPDGVYLISSSDDHTLRLWDTQIMSSATSSLPFEGHENPITSVGFSPNGTQIISCTYSGDICVWDSESGDMTLGPLEKRPDYWFQVAFSPDGTHIVANAPGGGIEFLNAQTGDVVLGPLLHSRNIHSVGLSSNGAHIACGSNGILSVLGVETGQTLMTIRLPLADSDETKEHLVSAVAFSPDGTRIAIGLNSVNLSIYNTRDGKLHYGPLDAYSPRSCAIGFSFDSARIVYINSTGSDVLVIDIRTEEKLLELVTAQTFNIISVEFSPDGSRIVSGWRDGRICVWDAQNGQLLVGPIRWHTGSVQSVKFSPDGTQVVSGSEDETIRVTNIQSTPADMGSLTQGYEGWEMKENGWVVDSQSRLLVWIPAELRSTLMWPRTKLLISRKGSFRLMFEQAYLGEAWTECYRPPQ